MSLHRYGEYKETEVPWLGEIPSHWELQQARRLFEQRKDSSLPGDEQLSATQKYGVIPQRLFMEQENQKVVLALSGLDNFKRVRPDDFVISLRSFQGGIERSRYAGCVSPAYTVLRPQSGVVPGFWEHLLKSSTYIAALQTTSDGIRDGKNISYGQFGSLCVPLPPQAEQIAIAAFIDRETAKIDALIAEQEKLIALLTEKRQAIISHAVIKGLNPNALMKDSGVAWLGEVPAHWDLIRVKRIVLSIEQGWSPQCENYAVEDANEWGVLKVGCVNGGVFNSSENKKLPQELEPITTYSLKRGDLLVSRANTRELVGSAAVVPTDFDNLLLCDKLYRLRLIESNCLAKYLAAYLGTYEARTQLQLEATGASSSMLNIGQPVILDLLMPLPGLYEQKEIFAFIWSETSKLDNLNNEVKRAIALLKERRGAIIAAAVTGQIDVRGAAVQEVESRAAIAA
jgi:type I restriction enzyme S subunit